MSSQLSSSSSHALKASDIIDSIGCLLSDTDDVLARIERRFRLSDVEKLKAFVAALSHAVDLLSGVDPGSPNQDLPLVDDQSLDVESEASEEDEY